MCSRDELVQDLRCIAVALEVEAAEAYEDRDRRAEVGEELAAPGHHPFPHRRQQPLAGDLLGELGPVGERIERGRCLEQRRQHAHRPALALPDLVQPGPLAERRQGPRVEDDVTRRRLRLGGSE